MDSSPPDQLSSGVPGLDSILHGGLPRNHPYLITGTPGTGKTSLAFQFLAEGVANDESTVYISFSESLEELRRVAESHGWPIDEIDVFELAADIAERSTAGSSIFHGAEVELPSIVSTILESVERVEPTRLAIDSLTELRNIAESHRTYRRALFQLKARFEQMGTTVLFVGESGQPSETEAESIVHGVIDLEMETPGYGPVHRRLQVSKLRGRDYESGFHDFAIETGGLQVFPRIRPKEIHREIGNGHPVESGVDSLDELLGGGLDRGTTGLIIGPTGTGKSSVVMQYAIAAAQRDERAVIYTFTEDTETVRRRAEGMELPLDEHMDSGHIRIRPIDSSELSPGQFAHYVRKEVTEHEVAFVAIDSLNGYIHAMPDQHSLVPHLHDLLTYLGGQGIIMMLVMTLSGLLGPAEGRVANLSYLADTVLYLRYFERHGEVGKSITAVKHRTRGHGKYVREFSLGTGGVQIGEPLEHFTPALEDEPDSSGESGEPSDSPLSLGDDGE